MLSPLRPCMLLVTLLPPATRVRSPVASLPVRPGAGGVSPLWQQQGAEGQLRRPMGCHAHLREELADPRGLVRPVREQKAVLLGAKLRALGSTRSPGRPQPFPEGPQAKPSVQIPSKHCPRLPLTLWPCRECRTLTMSSSSSFLGP